MKKFVQKHTLITMIIIVFVTILVCTNIGVADVTVGQTFQVLLHKLFNIGGVEGIKESTISIIWNIRLPRVLIALLVGGGLSICGVAYQGIFKNPMADPYTLGVSSGAALGASIGIAFNLTIAGENAVRPLAFIFALLTLTIVYSISKKGNKVPIATLLLSGVAMSQFLSAMNSVIMIFSDKMNQIVYWTMGSLNGKSWEEVFTLIPYVAIGFFLLYILHRQMDIMLIGEDSASQLGVNTERLKLVVLIVSALITAAAVSMTGIIGFVGLIVPHVVRIFVGPKHKKLYPYSFLCGGVFLILCDTASRSLMTQEIPVGVITAIFGGPFFIYLLRQNKSGGA